ncbi:hypothetical protein ACGFXC_10505 [Streptomyces sp. NPDC048507]|uniref:hypothetical protein n=1 Tax=Streptomyces sp. NPDC048507 TaxID=3365560 RepID=UPI00371CD4EC
MTDDATLACTACSRRSAVPRVLCWPCVDRARRYLAELPVLHDALAVALVPGSGEQQRVSGSREAPLPCVLDVLSLRGPGGMADILTEWLEAVHEARELGRPRWRGRDRVREVCQRLDDHMSWIALDFAAGAADLLAELKTLSTAARSLAFPERARVPLGVCPLDAEGGQPCGGSLQGSLTSGTVRCSTCRTVWPPTHLLLLGRMLGDIPVVAKAA